MYSYHVSPDLFRGFLISLDKSGRFQSCSRACYFGEFLLVEYIEETPLLKLHVISLGL